MRGTFALAALMGLAGLGGCISSSAETPEWFAERSAASDSSYPSLRSVPRTTIAITDAEHWEAIDRDLILAGQQLRDNPRAEPAPAGGSPDAFVDDAREDIETTRQSHEP